MANQILAYFHCAKCLKEKPRDQSPRQWVRLEAGWTPRGLQVWCVRHEENVIALDFLGQKVSQADPDAS
jgi:hypothetical protein